MAFLPHRLLIILFGDKMLPLDSTLRDNSSDVELVALIKNGNTDAFDALVNRYMSVLQACAAKYSGAYGAVREDLLQEGMITLFRAVKNYRAESGNQFNTYAITCIQNSMVSFLKKHLKNLRSDVNIDEIDELELHLAFSGSYCDQVGDTYLDMEKSSLRRLKIQTLLSDFERRVLRLYLQGYTYEQSSEFLNASTKAIDNALQRVRRKLRSDS